MTIFSDSTYPLFPFFAFLGFFLVLIPFPWHLQAWNAGTCLYMGWAAIACLNLFVNSVFWHANALNPAPVWCDISSRIIVGTAVALPAASLCINRRLYKIVRVSTVFMTHEEKRRAVIEDLLIGLGVPLVEIALEYVVAGHRFDIYEDIGCYPSIYNVWLAYLLVISWPVVIGLISAVYCVLSVIAFSKRRAKFKDILSTSKTSLTVDHYFRLMALATTELVCTTPLALYSVYMNLTVYPIQPYKGWADLHYHWSRVNQYPGTIWRLNKRTELAMELTRWLTIACAFVFFLFFGIAQEARRHYRLTALFIGKKIGLGSWIAARERKKAALNARAIPLPAFVRRAPDATESTVNISTIQTNGTRSPLTASSTPTVSTSPIADKPLCR